MENLGFEDSLRACALVMEEDAIQTAAIEGEKLNRAAVRSSIATRLGLGAAGLSKADRSADGLVEVLLDATHNFEALLDKGRLCRWHSALFPSGSSGLLDIIAGDWRTSKMQVISGAFGKQKVHFEAVPAECIEYEMNSFFKWFNRPQPNLDGIIRATLAHLRFVSIHPFDDGNGRIARAIADMALAQDERSNRRYYSISSQIMKDRDTYYKVLEKTQKGDGDCTEWLSWFAGRMDRAIEEAGSMLGDILLKAAFWKKHAETIMNARQKKALNVLLDAGQGKFQGGLSTRKYASIAKTSRSTAWREIQDMLQKKMIRALPGRGRSTAYEINYGGE
jgi:Fic family protein